MRLSNEDIDLIEKCWHEKETLQKRRAVLQAEINQINRGLRELTVKKLAEKFEVTIHVISQSYLRAPEE
jgi:hypothetical protein